MTGILMIAQRDIRDTNPNAAPLKHLFGGILSRQASSFYVDHGIDFGANLGFTNSGAILDLKANLIILVPVSDDSAAEFNRITCDLGHLSEAGKLPFYFSKAMKPKHYEELHGQPAIDLNGDVIPGQSPKDVERYQAIWDSGDLPEQLGAKLRILPKGMRRAPINCVRSFNMVAQLAGVDLDQIDPKWFEMTHNPQILQTLDRLLKSPAERIGMSEAGFDVRKKLVSDDRSVILISPTDITQKGRILKMIHAADDMIAGGLVNHFETLQPLCREKREMPAYMQFAFQQLSALEIS